MGNAFDNTELTLFDNKNRKLSLEACREMTNLEHYESHFKIHQGKGRHYVIFRVHTTIGLQLLKRHSNILNTLYSPNGPRQTYSGRSKRKYDRISEDQGLRHDTGILI
jgi:hypothetical protein